MTSPDDFDEVEERGPRSAIPTAEQQEWHTLLQYLHGARGFDFSGYKPTSLARRVRKRMDAVGVRGYAAYQDYLEVHPDEFAALFDSILINVTGFFRDPQAWDTIRMVVIPGILGSKIPGDPIRVWSAGCASGEEAYTLAMLWVEALGEEEYRARVKIYATDVDDAALNAARHATYDQRAVSGVPTDLLQKYFERINGLYSFRKDLRRQVIFGRHDLMTDAPISRIDLLVCRNTLMYFNAEIQARILSRFQFALNEGGFLFLGRAETLMAFSQSFVPVDAKRRVSRKQARAHAPLREAMSDEGLVPDSERINVPESMLDAALDAGPVAQIVLDLAGRVVFVNDRARALFGLRQRDVGRPFQDLQVSYRPIELRSILDRADVERRPVAVKQIEWRPNGLETRLLDLLISPLLDPTDMLLGFTISFTDVTAYYRLQQELEQSHQELETAHEELQSTNEELETTNEELQSTVEELETTNDELQSTNEELETMNQELQSTNEELETMNAELRQRGEELLRANAFLESVLLSIRSGVAVLDRELRVLSWNPHAQDLWGVRQDEVRGQHLLNLEIGLPVEQLRLALRACLNGERDGTQELNLQATNRRGKPIRCHVSCSPLMDHGGRIGGAIVLMEELSEKGS